MTKSYIRGAGSSCACRMCASTPCVKTARLMAERDRPKRCIISYRLNQHPEGPVWKRSHTTAETYGRFATTATPPSISASVVAIRMGSGTLEAQQRRKPRIFFGAGAELSRLPAPGCKFFMENTAYQHPLSPPFFSRGVKFQIRGTWDADF